MTFLYVLLAVLLSFFLLLSIRIRVVLLCNDTVRADLRILFFRFRLHPKKKKVRIKNYSYRRYQKRLEAARAKKEKKAKAGLERNAVKKKTPKPKIPLRQNIAYFSELFDGIYGRFLRYFRIDIARLRIHVATGDAAKTAILTGVVCQSVVFICEILDRHTNFHPRYRANISVLPDYLSEESRVDGKFVFSLRIGRILELGVRFFYRFLKLKLKKSFSRNIEREDMYHG